MRYGFWKGWWRYAIVAGAALLMLVEPVGAQWSGLNVDSTQNATPPSEIPAPIPIDTVSVDSTLSPQVIPPSAQPVPATVVPVDAPHEVMGPVPIVVPGG